MDSVDLEVLNTAVRWQEAGRRALLCTVVRTWGSAPRPVGSMMVIRDDGHVKGSISGGCIEDRLIEQIRDGELRCAVPELLTFGITGEEAHRSGLPCGGTLQILLEPVTLRSRLHELQTAVAQRRQVTRRLNIASGEVTLTPGGAVPALAFDGVFLRTSHGPRQRLVIIGAAQVSRYLAGMAQALDYQVIVCDPRSAYREEWDVAGVELSREMPDDLILRLQLDACSAVVALTHDPKLDDMALLEALKSPAFYVGAIGSRGNNRKRRERLALFDLSPAQIARLHGPVGLHLGARTPPEIAVAILAEMTAIRNGVEVVQNHALRSVEGGRAGCGISAAG